MVTLSSCLIWQIISIIHPSNEYGCVYACTTLGNIATLLCRFGQKKIIFSVEANFDLSGYVNKQNCCIWGTENSHAYIEKSTQCLVRILVQRHNLGTFLRKWARRGRYSQWRSLTEHVEGFFVHKKVEEENIVNIWLQPKLHSMFTFLKIVLSATSEL